MSDPVSTVVRPTFSEETINRAMQFAQDMLRLVPELEAIAITPSWTVPQPELPFGVIVGRNGALRNPAEIMHMATQLHGMLKVQLNNTFEVLRAVDAEMGRRKEELHGLNTELARVTAELAQRRNEAASLGSATGGTAPGHSG